MPHREADTKNIHVNELAASFLKQAETLGFSRAKVLVAFRELGASQSSPDTGVFTVSVNYDDQRWSAIQRQAYAYANPDLKPKHFPVGGRGVSEVVVEYVTFDHEPTTQEVMDKIQRRGLRVPDRAETESFLDTHPEEQKKSPVIGLCASVVARHGFRSVPDVYASAGERHLHFSWLSRHWSQYCRFFAVRKSST